MSRRGYAGTSVAEIVNGAGVGAPTLYWHFKNKEGILAAVMERGAERWFRSLPPWDAVSKGTRRERFAAVLSIARDSLEGDPQFQRLLLLLSLELGEKDEAILASIRSIRRRARDWTTGLLRHTWPALPKAAAEDLSLKMQHFADGVCLHHVIEPDQFVVVEGRPDWLAEVIGTGAAALAARALRKSRGSPRTR